LKYRHSFHAGNFADVHKHVTLVALLQAMSRKDKGFLFLDTHAGRGAYDLESAAARQGAESAAGIERLLEWSGRAAAPVSSPVLSPGPSTGPSPEPSPEIARYLEIVRAFRKEPEQRHGYPGSPLIAAALLRAQDRAVLVESEATEELELRRALRRSPAATARRIGTECDDGYARLTAWLPPLERRALLLIDPPYEESREDFRRVAAAAELALARLANAVVAIWYPIKLERDTERWSQGLAARLARPTLTAELWLHPRDSRVGLNGSGMLIVNPPYQLGDAMRAWLRELQEALAEPGQRHHSGHSVLEV
jgi:23S rRNA (adenine2030-N6)-methyltransferase